MSHAPEQVLTEHSGQIVKYDAMCKAIRECHQVDEVVNIRDKARALEVYAAQALNTDAERKACEIRLRAERRAGELLRDGKRDGSVRPKGKSHVASNDMREEAKLSDLGITRDQSSKWQALAEVPEEQFEQALRDPVTKPSTARLISKPKDQPKIDPMALWVWGRLRDFEADRVTDCDAGDLFDAMTETMQEDVLRLAPIVSGWLKEIGECG